MALNREKIKLDILLYLGSPQVVPWQPTAVLNIQQLTSSGIVRYSSNNTHLIYLKMKKNISGR